MTAEPAPASKATRNGVATAMWLGLGLFAYWFASLALNIAVYLRALFPLFMALMMESPVLGMILAVALAPLPPVLGYIAIRYWVLPSRPQDWRNAAAFPLIVLSCMIVACVLSGFITSLVFVVLQFLPIPVTQSLLIPVTGLLAGSCLYGIERLTTRLLFGRTEAARLGATLFRAHAAGIAVVLLAGSLPATLGIYVFHAAISQTWAKWLLLPIVVCGQLVHLLLAWWAWNKGSRPALPSARGVAGGLILAFVALSLIGAAVRAPSSVGPLRALAWPLSYFVGWPKA